MRLPGDYCEACGHTPRGGGHAADCKLAALLKQAKGE